MNLRSSLAIACCAAVLGSSPTVAQARDSTLNKIKETGAITLGYRESSVPFSYLDAKQRPVGMSIDLCQAVVARVREELGMPKLQVNEVAVNSSNRIPLVVNGTVDLECGSTANNAARQKQVAFSVTTFVSRPLWLVRTDAGIQQTSDLKGRTVVVTQGSNAVGFARKVNEASKLGMTIIQAKDHGESLLVLSSGRASAWLEDDILLAAEKANSRNASALAFMPGDFDSIHYGLMLRRDDPAFKSLVDVTLSTLMADGSFTTLYRKWFEEPIPPRNVSLDFPMTDQLKERIKTPSDRIDG